ncbi:hypothetical protein JCM19992_21130 [Thermostilla marina]
MGASSPKSPQGEGSLLRDMNNLPNRLTMARILLSIALFGVLSFPGQVAYLVGLVLFLLAAGTDWLDGYFARKLGLVTTLGRILDPFADKLIISGTFIFLAASPRMLETAFGLHPWIVVVIVGRELLITVIRSFMEQQGVDFSANWPGKIKMALQCVVVVVAMVYLSFVEAAPGEPVWLWWALVVSTYAALVSTVYSGAIYVVAAAKHLK